MNVGSTYRLLPFSTPYAQPSPYAHQNETSDLDHPAQVRMLPAHRNVGQTVADGAEICSERYWEVTIMWTAEVCFLLTEKSYISAAPKSAEVKF